MYKHLQKNMWRVHILAQYKIVTQIVGLMVLEVAFAKDPNVFAIIVSYLVIFFKKDKYTSEIYNNFLYCSEIRLTSILVIIGLIIVEETSFLKNNNNNLLFI